MLDFFKLYVKKLILSVVFGSCCFISIIFSFLSALFFEIENDELLLLLFLSISTIIFSLFVGTTRYASNKRKVAFLSNECTENLSFFKHILLIIKSQDFIAELLACLPTTFVIWSYISLSHHNPDPFLLPTLQKITATIQISTIFSLIDIFIWYLIQKKWLKAKKQNN